MNFLSSVTELRSSLRAAFHFAAIFGQVFGQILRAATAQTIARHYMVDELGVRQLQVGHDVLELLKVDAIPQAKKAKKLLRNRRYASAAVVMSGVDQIIIGKG